LISKDDESGDNKNDFFDDCSPPTRLRIEAMIRAQNTDEYNRPLISEKYIEEKLRVALEETPYAPSNLSPRSRMEYARK
jgi:hypothetical protein